MSSISEIKYSNEADFLQAVEWIRVTNEAEKERLAQAETVSFDSMLSIEQQRYSPTASMLTPSATLESIFQKASATYQVPLDLLKAVAMQESNFQSDIVSSSGAVGIMQLMPGTAAYLGVTDSFDPEQNVMGGAKLLQELLARYNGDIPLALAGYNAGVGNVEKYGGIPPFEETQNYIQKVMAYMQNGVTIPEQTLPSAPTTPTAPTAPTTPAIADHKVETVVYDYRSSKQDEPNAAQLAAAYSTIFNPSTIHLS